MIIKKIILALVLTVFLKPCLCGLNKTSLHYLKKVSFSGNETVLNITQGTEDLNALIAGCYIPKGKLIGINPDKKKVAQATKTYKAVENFHLICMDALLFDFDHAIDIVLAPFPHLWVHDLDIINLVIKNVTRSLKRNGCFYIWSKVADNQANQLVQALIATQEYNNVTYTLSKSKKSFRIMAQKI